MNSKREPTVIDKPRRPQKVTTMRSDIEQPIEVIAEIINEASTCNGMSKEDTDALKQALRDLVSAILRT